MSYGGAATVAGYSIPEKHHRAKFGMWLFLTSEIMFFTGFIGAYIALYNSSPTAGKDACELNWVIALINTIVLITSSLTMARAVAASKRGDAPSVQLHLVLTMLLAFTFMGIKAYEYGSKFAHGYTPSYSPFFSAYYLLTGFHGLHVLGGIVVMWHLLAFSFAGKYTKEYNIPMEVTGLYWHFVDIVWIFLFPMLYLLSPIQAAVGH